VARRDPRRISVVAMAGLIGVALLAPWIAPTPYLRHILIVSALNASLALSFDLPAGHLGHVSLAHPAFFGTGAYVAAIFNTRWDLPVGLTVLGAVAGSAVLALLTSIPFFRLSELSFAIGTLGLSLVAQAVANNWIPVTGGPMCITGIASLAWGPLSRLVSPQQAAAVFAVGVGVLAGALYVLLTTFRVGRALAAVHGDEVLAAALGVNPLRYKALVFTTSAGVAGLVGSVYAHYTTVICPDDLSPILTLNILVMVFVGGLGSLRGVLVGAVLFTALTEAARFAEAYSQLIYGVVLLGMILFAPDGVEAVFRRLRERAVGRRGQA
jgi:ABC-type branched-subunit amino acid transport system permease subunit